MHDIEIVDVKTIWVVIIPWFKRVISIVCVLNSHKWGLNLVFDPFFVGQKLKGLGAAGLKTLL